MSLDKLKSSYDQRRRGMRRLWKHLCHPCQVWGGFPLGIFGCIRAKVKGCTPARFLKRNHHILQYKRNVALVDRLIWQHTCASDLTSPQHQILTPFSTPLNSNKNLEYRQANSLLFSEYTTKQSIDRFSRFFCVLYLDRKYSFVSRVFLE